MNFLNLDSILYYGKSPLALSIKGAAPALNSTPAKIISASFAKIDFLNPPLTCSLLKGKTVYDMNTAVIFTSQKGVFVPTYLHSLNPAERKHLNGQPEALLAGIIKGKELHMHHAHCGHEEGEKIILAGEEITIRKTLSDDEADGLNCAIDHDILQKIREHLALERGSENSHYYAHKRISPLPLNRLIPPESTKGHQVHYVSLHSDSNDRLKIKSREQNIKKEENDKEFELRKFETRTHRLKKDLLQEEINSWLNSK